MTLFLSLSAPSLLVNFSRSKDTLLLLPPLTLPLQRRIGITKRNDRRSPERLPIIYFVKCEELLLLLEA